MRKNLNGLVDQVWKVNNAQRRRREAFQPAGSISRLH